MGQRPPRRYWLTGAGNGVGASLAQAILETGANLAISSSSAQSCEALSARYPGHVLTMPGDLTDGQTVRDITDRIAQQWGALDTLILNAGTTEYVNSQLPDASLIEHIVRSNLMVASLCIETASPLLRAGTAPLLVGIISPATSLSPSHTEGGNGAMRYLFESARASENIDITLVRPDFDNALGSLADFPATPGSADEAAAYILSQLVERPHEVLLPVTALTALWPLPTPGQTAQADIDPCQVSARSPIKGRP
ncbi:SDR family NAD(P)-dependent oxidoreductase [Pseudomonas corrugata]|uniref:Short-chain dehydrogenase/reductase SDR n=1 Tax=Pseudomonas corrugata TaxID=47879 RepID=A0A3M3F0K9_9PSED|nr:SDR family NAD(P)-dependent oxidoreductase [Pseudomonas corrugata]AOE62168.1 short-chain dehydrogenase [Pseudomonas corrugata]MDU9023048.1 SDR family NAD(P)-dependent oxidoreductase [Pseudomonas corrugata]MDU9033344.1 SDR family NAD(P)-dependent oxidoreductase [Pseudomonas corrugata]MDU9040381.1 SDR family NAD(P)-dependent oxidoreductase [Pseudomonas corrugata]QTH13390.1 SDR family NAD(P)-dependent oxidoreductase [Pseudomonas corrugata]